jgi:hypothetical protein
MDDAATQAKQRTDALRSLTGLNSTTAPTLLNPASEPVGPKPDPPPKVTKKVRKSVTAPLQDMLEAMFASEHMNEANGNAYSCDRCGKKTHATRTTYLQRVPNILIVSANRFEYDLMMGRRKKIMNEIAGDWSTLRADVLVRDVVKEQAEADKAEAERKAAGEAKESVVVAEQPGPAEEQQNVPDGMDVDPEQRAAVASPEAETTGSDEQTAASEEPAPLETTPVYYDLWAVVFHSGYSADYGHYYAYAAQEGALDSAKVTELAALTARQPWYKFNDSSVNRTLVLDDVLKDGSVGGDTPYILFYRRRPDHADPETAIRNPALPELDRRAIYDFVTGHDKPRLNIRLTGGSSSLTRRGSDSATSPMASQSFKKQKRWSDEDTEDDEPDWVKESGRQMFF